MSTGNTTNVLKAAGVAVATAALAMELDKRHSVRHDLKLGRKLVASAKDMRRTMTQGLTVADGWEEVVDHRPDQLAIVFVEDDSSNTRSFTYKQLDDWANQVAHFLSSAGVKKGEDVALFMENRPEFIGTWLGIAKIGARVAMINTAVKEKGLIHCIQATSSRYVIYGKELEEPFNAIRASLGPVRCWVQGSTAAEDAEQSMDVLIRSFPTTRPPRLIRNGVTP